MMIVWFVALFFANMPNVMQYNGKNHIQQQCTRDITTKAKQNKTHRTTKNKKRKQLNTEYKPTTRIMKLKWEFCLFFWFLFSSFDRKTFRYRVCIFFFEPVHYTPICCGSNGIKSNVIFYLLCREITTLSIDPRLYSNWIFHHYNSSSLVSARSRIPTAFW